MNPNTEQLARLWFKQQGRCFYCEGDTALLSRKSKKEWKTILGITKQFDWHVATREHLLRRTDGGADGDDNIVMACCFCNSTRRTLSVELHRQAIRVMAATGQHPVRQRRPVRTFAA